MKLFEAIQQAFESAGIPLTYKLVAQTSQNPVRCGAVYLKQRVAEFESTIEVAGIMVRPPAITLSLRSLPVIRYSASDPDLIEKLVRTVKERYDYLAAKDPISHVMNSSATFSSHVTGPAFTMSGVSVGPN